MVGPKQKNRARPDESALTVLSQGALDRAVLGRVRILLLATDRIRDLSRLRAAPLLEKVVIDETAVRDLGPLTRLARLQELHLYDNPDLDDLTPLGQLSKLRALEVGAPRRGRVVTRGLRTIAGLPALESLSIWCAPRARLGWLASMTGLRRLTVHGSRIDAAWLGGLHRLGELHLTATGTAELASLADLGALSDLWLCQNRIRDLRPLRRLSRLTRLLLHHNAIEDLSPLAGLDRLVRLDAPHNRVATLPSLRKLTRLESLDLAHNALTDVSRIHGLRRLENLFLGHNALTDVAGLRDLPRLRCLFLDHNRIRDLRPLLGLRSLVAVQTAGNRAETSFLRELPSLIRIDSTSIAR